MATVNIVRLPGDYQLLAKNGGIVIDAYNDTSPRSATAGAVTIYGDLNVVGDTSFIASTNTNIVDNIMFLNSGETNAYVTLGVSGLAISRGNIVTTFNAATLLFNDNEYWSVDNITTATRGVWEFSVANETAAIRTDAIRVSSTRNELNLFGTENPTAKLTVKGTTDYELQMNDDDDIPNKKYVDDRFYVGQEFAQKLQVGNSFIEINDSDVSPPGAKYWTTDDRIIAALGTSTNVVFRLQGVEAAVQGLTITDTNIGVNGGRLSQNIRISAANASTGTVEIASPLSLSYLPTPNGKNNFTNIYSTATIAGGGTGVFFINGNTQDELVSRRRAIIYGIIF
jgi:hypothetical protein